MLHFFRRNQILFLFSIIPFGYLFSFVLVMMGATNVSSYFALASLLLLIKYSSRSETTIGNILLLVYMIFNVIYFEGNVATNSREIVPFIIFLATCYNSKYIISQLRSLNKHDVFQFFKWFSLLFVICFIITVLIVGKKVNDEMDDVRVYYDGFVISHHFSYFAILLSFIFLKYRNWKSFLLLGISAFFVGNRISYLAFAITFVLYLESIKSTYYAKFISRYSFISLIILVGIILYFTIIDSSINWQTVSTFLLDSDNRDFTSGRSLFWYNGINELRSVPIFGFNFFFGLGPDSVEILATRLYNKYYWMHNDFLQIYYCYGVVGISLYFYALYYMSKNVKTSVAIWLVLVTAMFNGFYTYGALQLFIMIMLVMIINPLEKRRKKKYFNHYA